ncbi:MAG: hypothetical protein JO138_24680 [Acidobacteriaceae bacterium]|nr:hypothetical protein [Acidobacteriaceae bacterium]
MDKPVLQTLVVSFSVILRNEVAACVLANDELVDMMKVAHPRQIARLDFRVAVVLGDLIADN